LIVSYKESYTQLKDLKTEIEHLQHLLEAARKRLTRDFEHWYENVYKNVGSASEVDEYSNTHPSAGANSKAKYVDQLPSELQQTDLHIQVQYEPSKYKDMDLARPHSSFALRNAPAPISRPASVSGNRLPRSTEDDVAAFYRARDEIRKIKNKNI
jgi:hypothetical protein